MISHQGLVCNKLWFVIDTTITEQLLMDDEQFLCRGDGFLLDEFSNA